MLLGLFLLAQTLLQYFTTTSSTISGVWLGTIRMENFPITYIVTQSVQIQPSFVCPLLSKLTFRGMTVLAPGSEKAPWIP